MIINILSKSEIKKLIEEQARIEFNKIYSYLNKLNQRIMSIEEVKRILERLISKYGKEAKLEEVILKEYGKNFVKLY